MVLALHEGPELGKDKIITNKLVFGNRPNTVSESTVSNTELRDFLWPHRVPGRELSEFLSADYLFDKATSPSFSQNSPSLPQNSVRLSEFSLRNSTLETVLRPLPKCGKGLQGWKDTFCNDPFPCLNAESWLIKVAQGWPSHNHNHNYPKMFHLHLMLHQNLSIRKCCNFGNAGTLRFLIPCFQRFFSSFCSKTCDFALSDMKNATIFLRLPFWGDAKIKTALDDTWNDFFLGIFCVPMCRRGISCDIQGYPKLERWGTAGWTQ